ncbi:hypothetical protein JJB11_05165 [Ramlibacter ginsenosidimutans]|uniref:Uncharacterized protein n=1 Tax=Ramlibacter ginsenosidimutans TaxID=502333 RepID=A0A934TQM5_9BURK|nr:hypothetical protein [Ramlibacter ginsenosidimutans]MBK6005473.1 hypothetical protein [Ramlibacter ginsenosidimutans]
MDAINAAEAFIASNPTATESAVLRKLLQALQEDSAFDLHSLYELNLASFDLAIDVMNAWRLQRYVRGRVVVAAVRLDQH